MILNSKLFEDTENLFLVDAILSDSIYKKQLAISLVKLGVNEEIAFKEYLDNINEVVVIIEKLNHPISKEIALRKLMSELDSFVDKLVQL